MVVAVSHSLKDLILKMGYFHNKVFVIHNGARHDIFFPMDKIKTRRSLNLPDDRKIILFIGSLIRIKGIDTFFRSFINMSEKNHSNLVIIGKGVLEYQLKALACGRAVVAPEVGGIPETITNGTLRILVAPNNTEDLAAAFNKALEREWDYQAIQNMGNVFHGIRLLCRIMPYKALD